MERKKIALFTRYLPMGGIQKIMIRLANEFAEREYDVDLVLAKGKGALAGEVSADVRIVDLNKHRAWKALPALLRYLKQESPDSLLSAGDPSNIMAIWGKIFASRQTRFVPSVHMNLSLYSQSENVWYSRLIPYLVQIFYPLADTVVTVSEGIKRDLLTISEAAHQKSQVVYNPVIDQEVFQKSNQSISHPWLQQTEQPVILGVGRLTEQKNFDLLLRAFALVQREHQARLIILGDGRLRDDLEARTQSLGISDRVDLHGFVENPYPFMAHASLFVMSSIFEGLPTVLIEALACGCPIVSTDCPSGPREILEDGKWGRLVPVGDEEALANAMLEALSETHDPDRLRQRAMDFSVDRAVDEYLEVLFPENHSG